MQTKMFKVSFQDVPLSITFYAKSGTKRYGWIKTSEKMGESIDKTPPTIKIFEPNDKVEIEMSDK